MNLRQLQERYSDPELVLVYQFGKVGSSSLAASIDGAVNVHDLFANPICPPGFRFRNSFLFRHVGFPVDRAVRRGLLRRRDSVDIIVPVRPPWERNVSMFFQDLAFWYTEYFSTRKSEQKVEGIELLQQIFMEIFPHDAPDRWFQEEFTKLTAIELDKIDFDNQLGYLTVEEAPYRCLFLTTEHLRTIESQATLSMFLGRTVSLTSRNRGSQKWYGSAYDEFLADAAFISEYKDRVATSQVQRTFFL